MNLNCECKKKTAPAPAPANMSEEELNRQVEDLMKEIEEWNSKNSELDEQLDEEVEKITEEEKQQENVLYENFIQESLDANNLIPDIIFFTLRKIKERLRGIQNQAVRESRTLAATDEYRQKATRVAKKINEEIDKLDKLSKKYEEWVAKLKNLLYIKKNTDNSQYMNVQANNIKKFIIDILMILKNKGNELETLTLNKNNDGIYSYFDILNMPSALTGKPTFKKRGGKGKKYNTKKRKKKKYNTKKNKIKMRRKERKTKTKPKMKKHKRVTRRK